MPTPGVSKVIILRITKTKRRAKLRPFIIEQKHYKATEHLIYNTHIGFILRLMDAHQDVKVALGYAKNRTEGKKSALNRYFKILTISLRYH